MSVIARRAACVRGDRVTADSLIEPSMRSSFQKASCLGHACGINGGSEAAAVTVLGLTRECTGAMGCNAHATVVWQVAS
jgi:hypothetical protein